MSKRPSSSYASSSVGLHPINLNSNSMHSQTWTLVNEFYMGGRQQRVLDPHEGWKYDLECQIAAMEDKVRDSQEQFPETGNGNTGIGRKPTQSVPQVLNDFEKNKLEMAKNQNRSAAVAQGVDRNKQGTDNYNRGRQSKIASVITTATEAHLGRMDTTFHGAVLGPNTGRSFNTGK